MPTYRLALAGLGTTGLGSVIEDDVLDRTGVPSGDAGMAYTTTLDGAGSLEVSLPLDDPFVTQENFATLEREFHLYRDEVLVFGGRLVRAEVTSLTSVRFLVEGWLAQLARRRVVEDLVFTQIDQVDIAWSLIDYTQNRTDGNLGITRESLSGTGVLRDKAFCLGQGTVVSDAIADLAGTYDGFDYEVGPDKVWRTWHRLRGEDKHALVAFDTATNVLDFRLEIDGTQAANDVLAINDLGSCETPVYEFDIDTVARGKYGLMESDVTSGDVSNEQLFAMAQEELRVSKDPRLQASVTVDTSFSDVASVPDLSVYGLGDRVQLTASTGFATFDRSFRVLERRVTVRAGDLERTEVTLDGVVA